LRFILVTKFADWKGFTNTGSLDPSKLYESLFSYSLPEDVDPDAVYPLGDTFISIDPIGSLLLLANEYTRDAAIAPGGHEDSLSMHMRLVDEYLDDAPLSVVDAIVLVGIRVEKDLTKENTPPFKDPESPEAASFLEYLQV
jgi:hypothetical protein